MITRGEGPGVVLLSGLLGGLPRLAPTADALVARGFRVVTIDPYRLSAQAQDVSFHGMAREVERALERIGMTSAVVVAHAHATGIALRLAANAPHLVDELVLIEGGLLHTTRSAGVSRAMQVASLIARLPGGQALIRASLASGIRANSGDARWLTEAAAREYTDGLLKELPAVARMADRLANAHEPEPPEALLPRLRARILMLVGAAPHDFAPNAKEIDPLSALPAARVRRIEGVGHFVHEEALQLVVREIEAARSRAQGSANATPPTTTTGTGDCMLEPSPSCPLELSPQHQAAPGRTTALRGGGISQPAG